MKTSLTPFLSVGSIIVPDHSQDRHRQLVHFVLQRGPAQCLTMRFSKSLYIMRLLHSLQGTSLWMMLVQFLEEDCFLCVSCLDSDDDSWIHPFDLKEALEILWSARFSLGWLDAQYGANASADPDLWSTSMTLQGIASRSWLQDWWIPSSRVSPPPQHMIFLHLRFSLVLRHYSLKNHLLFFQQLNPRHDESRGDDNRNILVAF